MKTIITHDDNQGKENYDSLSPGVKALLWTLVVFMILWSIAGLIGFIVSIVCFSASGSTAEKIVGILLSLFFGPFYWFYYAFNKNYCNRKPKNAL